ncbi:MAG: glycine cleavage T C-terminal barrel domain-containing protein [Planctomycetota bacterium]|nr:glycine cleavage T C-terminal barrel domain-containing protein [Planctomycetota bacterium]
MNESPLLPLHRKTSAQFAADDTTLLTFGDVPAEYAAAQERAALFDVTDRSALVVRGPDATVFLHRLLANEVKKLGAHRSQRNLLLSSKGKVLFDFELAFDGERYTISTPLGRASAFAKALDMYLFSEKVQIEDATATHAPIEICGPRAEDIVRTVLAADLPIGDGACAKIEWVGAQVVVTRLPVAGSPGLRLDVGPDGVHALWTALVASGARPAGRIVRDILRVEAGAAEALIDIDENVYPQEARLESAFSLDKGCYIGQEVIAKIDTYGGLNKRLVALKVSNDDPIARGTRLFRNEEGEWRDLGVVTSWAYSFVLDSGLALAYVKRRHQKNGTEFRVGDGPTTAVIVPLPVRANAVAITGEFE